MGEVIQIHRESVVGFLRRNGPTLTHEVAQRFGWHVADARRHLKNLERSGAVSGRIVRYYGLAGGLSIEWTAKEERDGYE